MAFHRASTDGHGLGICPCSMGMCCLVKLFPYDPAELFFKAVLINSLFQGIINKGLIATFSGLGLEVSNNPGIEHNGDTLLFVHRLKPFTDCRTLKIRLSYFRVFIKIRRGF